MSNTKQPKETKRDSTVKGLRIPNSDLATYRAAAAKEHRTLSNFLLVCISRGFELLTGERRKAKQ